MFAVGWIAISGSILYRSIDQGSTGAAIAVVAMLSVGVPFFAWAVLMMPTRVETDEVGVRFGRGGREVRVAWDDLRAVRSIRFGYGRPMLRWVSTSSSLWTSSAFERLDELLAEVRAHASTAGPR